MNNDLFLGSICTALIIVPTIGIQIIHTQKKNAE